MSQNTMSPNTMSPNVMSQNTMSQNTMSPNKSPIISADESNVDATEIRDALNDFYKLKAKYETTFYDKFLRPIILSKTKSKREKRVDYSKLPKPECVNCKRNVGSIFTIKYIKDDYKRLFTAKCGDISDPCPFNITIEIADKQQLDVESVIINKELNDIKTDIVKGKNDMMFGYIEQNKAVSRFNATAEELKEKTEMAGYVINTNITINYNPKVIQLLNHLETEFGENLLLPFKSMIKEYSEEHLDRSKMVEAITFYKNEMIPKIAEIQRLKYKTDYVDFKPVAETGESTDLYVLVQRKNSLASLEFSFFSEDKLISNVKGVYEDKGEPSASASARARTRKNRELSKNGTKKNRPLVELVEDVDVADVDVDVADVVPVAPGLEEALVVEPILEEESGPKLTDEDAYRKEYDYIFSHLNPKYQKILSEDEAWLRKTINSFIEFNKLKKAGKTRVNADREFVHPDGILYPPLQISEGRFDYGHPVYNQILNPDNKIMDPLQIRVLHTYLEPDVTRKDQRAAYLTMLASLISSVVGFTKF
jgi:hypothetical protein